MYKRPLKYKLHVSYHKKSYLTKSPKNNFGMFY